ncbi:MAG: TonB-dependent receptor [Archangiaceae bacterium]|nr:TonB-dependent receptor [Archangiaceae bacterium]
MKYTGQLSSAVALNVYARYMLQSPWQANTSRDLELGCYSDKRIHRTQVGASVTVKPISWLNVLAGVEGTYDLAIAQQHGVKEVDEFNDYLDVDGNLTPAARLLQLRRVPQGHRHHAHRQHHRRRFPTTSLYGPSFVPRVALTKEIGRFHAKALVARAFRAPVFENIAYGRDVKPEYITVFELETGFQFMPSLYAGVNVFDNRVSPTLVYQEVGLDSLYLNGGTTGTHGLELKVRTKASWGYLKASYSFYEATVRGVTQFLVDGHPELFLGAPQHRFTLHGSLRLGDHLAINPALVVYSEALRARGPSTAASPR